MLVSWKQEANCSKQLKAQSTGEEYDEHSPDNTLQETVAVLQDFGNIAVLLRDRFVLL